MINIRKREKILILTIPLILISSLFLHSFVFSAPPSTPYNPGETLDPNCSPGDTNCTVYPPLPTYISTTTIVQLNNNLLSFNTGTLRILGILDVLGTTTFNGVSYRWPTNPPLANQFLQADGAGNLQWVDVTVSTAGGWTDEGTIVRLQTITDSVAIGTTSAPEKLTVQGNILSIGNLTITGTGTFQSSPLTIGNLVLSHTGLTASRTFTFPDISDTLVSLTATQTLTNKTLGVGSTWQGNIISTQYGGTGLSSIGTANQILGVNAGGTGLEYKNITSLLTAGTGISITGTTNATIANTGILSLTAGPGISISSGQNPTITNLGVLSLNSATGTLTLQGTPNQVNVNTSGNTITLSTPQDIHTGASPTFAGLTLSSLTPGSVLFAGSGGIISQNNSNLFWDNTNKRLGIGTSTPTGILHVATGTINALVVHNTGNVGIGTTAPSQKLTVAGNIGIQAGANAFIGTLDNYALSLRTNNTDRIFITNTGNVGIGTTTPATLLQVVGTTTARTILPEADNFYSLGAPGFRWANIYAATGTFGNTIIIGSNTIQGSSTTTLFTTGNPNQLVLGLDGSINIGGNITGTGNLTITGTTTLATTTVSRLTISELQKGSILFAGDNGLISQDNSNLFWDNTNKRLGIGTSSPQYTLDLVGTLRAGNTTLEEGSLIWWTTSNFGYDDSAQSVAVDSTGIYVVGYAEAPGNRYWRIEKRSLNDGSLIWATTTDPSSGDDYAYSVAIDSTGIYIVGNDRSLGPINYQWRIEKRSISTGELIWATTTNPSNSVDSAQSVAVDSTGIYVVGYDYAPGNYQWRIEKRNLNDGSLIWSVTSNPSSGSDVAYSVAVDSTGIYVVGIDRSLGTFNSQWRIEKRNLNDGSLIWSVTSNPSSGDDYAYSVAVDSTGIYVVGIDYSPGNYQWRIEKRSTSTGALIWSVTSNPSSGGDYAYSVAVDSTGIYVVGIDYSPGNSQWRIEKRNLNDGSLIWSVTSNPSSGDDYAQSVAVDSTGIYVVGDDRIPGDREWRIEKRRKYDENKPLFTVTSNNNVLRKLDVIGTALIRGSEANTTGLYVNEYGYVGIGTNNPSNLIEVKDLIKFLGSNTFLGYQSGYSNTTGGSNVGIGYQALYSNTTGGGNVGIGDYALYSNLTGFENIAIGNSALRSSTSSSYNVGIGHYALYSNTTGENNVGIGYFALYSNTTGENNVGIGYNALSYNTTGQYNVGIGNNALLYNQSGSANVVMGYSAGQGAYNTSYSSSTIIGYQAGFLNRGSGNILIGYQAGDNITTGNRNIIIGYDIDAPSTTASYQLNIGNIIFGTNIDGIGTTISSGNIGIGTTTPTAKLHVFGSTTLGASTSTPINFVGYINSNIIPFSDNVYTLGAPGFRWANIYAATTTIGDLVFANQFRFTESTSSPLALYLKNQFDENILEIDEYGNLKVKGGVYAQSFNVVSTKEEKKDINEITSSTEILENIRNMKFYSYRYLQEGSSSLHIGLIAEEAPKEILGENKKSIDLYKFVSYIGIGVKAIAEKLQNITSSTIDFVNNAVSYVKELITEKIVAKRATVENLEVLNNVILNKIQMKDQSTGEIYCVWIENGEWKKVKGECDATSTINSQILESTSTQSTTTQENINDSSTTENTSTTTTLNNTSSSDNNSNLNQNNSSNDNLLQSTEQNNIQQNDQNTNQENTTNGE
jgi:preprotein translocase subunit Sss1